MSHPLARRFTHQDQIAFAEFTGDRNPMHMDPHAARRTQAGSCAVHGMHAFLWSLDALAADAPVDRLASARVEFQRFLRLDEPVRIEVTRRTEDRLHAELHQSTARCVTLDLRFAPAPRAAQAPAAASGGGTLPVQPREPSFEAMAACRGELAPPAAAGGLAGALFPRVAHCLGEAVVASIGLLSTLVGMTVPGRHSIFSGFSIELGGERTDHGLAYAVSRTDERFRLITVDVAGAGFTGSVRAFARFPPVPPPSLADLERHLRPAEFAGRRALVIGGSRGIGAVTAKLIAAGGGSVALTYFGGEAEAKQIRAEIAERYGAGRCAIGRYDAAHAPAAQLAELGGPFSHLYYFATGRIFDHAGLFFDRVRFDRFIDVYVAGFERLARHVVGQAAEGDLAVFYPSSVAVQERPKNMTEYAMAKAAGEILCADLARAFPRLSITTTRLPRILTDQTATVPPVPAADPVEIMLPLLRAEGR